jgi:hypothetical protein
MPNDKSNNKRCNKPAAPFIPRWGMYWACALEEGHEGECMPGGTCYAHGEYIGMQCPKFPECYKLLIKV